MGQHILSAEDAYASIIGSQLVVVATAVADSDFAAVAGALEAANRVASEPTAQLNPSYRIRNLASTSHSVTAGDYSVVAVVIATYEISQYVYYEPDE